MSSLISGAKKAENLAEARAAMAEAQRKATTNWKRWKPDWEAAARYYRDAVKLYKMSGVPEETVQALRGSAIAHKEIDSFHTSAADLEAAATITRDDLHNSQEASKLFKESADLYILQGSSYDKAATMLVRAAESLGETDVEGGVELMKQACGIFEEQGRAMFHDATFKKAICFCVHKEKYGTARQLIVRQMAMQKEHLNPFEADMYKNILSMVVLRFHMGKCEEACADLLKYEGTERFARSEECLAANELVAAWEDADEDKWNATMKKGVFKYLHHPIAQIARKMKLPEGAGQGPNPHVDAHDTNNAAGGEDDGGASEAMAAAAIAPAKKTRGKKIILDEEGELDLR